MGSSFKSYETYKFIKNLPVEQVDFFFTFDFLLVLRNRKKSCLPFKLLRFPPAADSTFDIQIVKWRYLPDYQFANT